MQIERRLDAKASIEVDVLVMNRLSLPSTVKVENVQAVELPSGDVYVTAGLVTTMTKVAFENLVAEGMRIAKEKELQP